MTKSEEIQLLLKLPNFYLWNKRRSKWTAQDIENLKNGTDVKRDNASGVKCPVIVITETEKKQYKSIAEASRNCGVPASKIYNILYGNRVQLETIKFILL